MTAPSQRPLQLTADQQEQVRNILHRHLPPSHQAWIFGSRATGRARPFSDLDVLLTEPESLTWDQLARLRDDFEASTLPFRVDVVQAHSLSGDVASRVKSEMRPLGGWCG